MGGTRALRLVAMFVAAGIAVVALLGLTTTSAGAAAPAAHDCAAVVGCEPSAVSAQAAPRAPADPVAATVPCLHSAGCGGGGALTLIGTGLALLFAAAPVVLPPRARSWLMRPQRTTRLPRLLLARDDGQPPRLAAVTCI